MAAWSRSSAAAFADSAHPSTGTPLACHASRAASSANVLPVPAGARTTTAPRSPRVTSATSSRCSEVTDGRLVSALSTELTVATPAIGRGWCARSIALCSSCSNSDVL